MVRAKFTCISSTRRQGWGLWDPQTQSGVTEKRFIYDYEFQAVTNNDSEENKLFFASTPSGNLTLAAVRGDLFEPGQDYYLDFTPAESQE